MKLDDVEIGATQMDMEIQILIWETDLARGNQLKEPFSRRVKFSRKQQIHLE
jgi:hypothetical protein